jgi:hypothetical protein
MMPADSGKFAELVDLSGPRKTLAVVYLEFLNGEPVPISARDKFPPETLLHGAEFIQKLDDDVFRSQNKRAAGIVNRNAKEELIYAVKSAGH